MSWVLGALGIMNSAVSMVPAISRYTQYVTNSAMPNVIVDPMIAIELLRRNIITPSHYEAICQNHGYSKENSFHLLNATNRLLDVSDFVKLRFRNKITLQEYHVGMKSLGINVTDANKILQSNMNILSPIDIATLRQRNKISESEFNEYMNWLGVNNQISKHYSQLLLMELAPDEIISLYRRDLITKDQYQEYLKRLGYSKPQSDQLLQSREMLLNPTDLVVLLWRNEIDLDSFLKEMRSLGFEDERSRQFETRMKFYPSAQDLITWTAKEVFEPDAIEKYGLEDEFDLLRLEDFSKAGITEEQVKNYWIAHWEHPNFNAMREMYFRSKTPEGERKLSYDDIYEWFRLVEIPPYWRDKFIDIMHEPFTRVDIRRMHAMGVLNDQEVLEAYKELGYDQWKAEKLLEFTISYNMPSERDLSKTMLEKAYEYGEINRTTFLNYLVGLGYNKLEADLMITLFEIKVGQEEFDTTIDTIMIQFKNGVLDQEQVIAELNRLNVKGAYRDNLLAKMIREKQATFKLPSKDDILTWFVFKKLDLETTKDYLNRLGFRPVDIDLYIETATIDLTAKERGDLGLE